MIEEIKKEIHKQEEYYMCTKCNDISKEDINKIYIKKDKVFEILDKYKNQEVKYKNAWEELIKKQDEINEVFKKLEIPIKKENHKKISKCSLYDSNQKSFLNNTTKTGVNGRYLEIKFRGMSIYNGRLV